MRDTAKPRKHKGFFPIYPTTKIRKVEWNTGTDIPFGVVKVDSWIEPGLWYWCREALERKIISGFWMHPQTPLLKFSVDNEGKLTYKPDFVITAGSDVMEQFCQFEQWDAPDEFRDTMLPPHRRDHRVHLIEAKGSVAFARGMVMKPFKPKQILLHQKGIPVNLVFPEPYEKNKRKYSGFYQQTFCPIALASKLGGAPTALFKKSAGTAEDMIARDANRTTVRVTENTIAKCDLGTNESGRYLVSNWIDGTIMFDSPDHRYCHKLRANKREAWVDVRGRHDWGYQVGPDTHQGPHSFARNLAERGHLLMSKSTGYVRIEEVV